MSKEDGLWSAGSFEIQGKLKIKRVSKKGGFRISQSAFPACGRQAHLKRPTLLRMTPPCRK
jgi:hypothetical protein